VKTLARAILICLLLATGLGAGHTATGLARVNAYRQASAKITYRFFNIDLGGYKLFMECTGTGSPTVIFESGAWMDSSQWSQVMPPLPGMGAINSLPPSLTRYCAYDRAGEGDSGASPHGRSASTVVHELHILLAKAGIAPPYVLVGHSIAGLYIRLYAYTFPKEIVGMVLVDGDNEEEYDALARAGDTVQNCTGSTGCEEVHVWRQNRDELRAARKKLGPHPLGSIPLAVLTATLKDEPVLGVWLKYQKQLAALSTNSRQIFDSHTQHDIPTDSPGLVTEAVEKVVAAVRNHGQLPPVNAWRCGDGSGFCRS
jgi:pimeloyl-ACP methyl ester carboxylesterase